MERKKSIKMISNHGVSRTSRFSTDLAQELVLCVTDLTPKSAQCGSLKHGVSLIFLDLKDGRPPTENSKKTLAQVFLSWEDSITLEPKPKSIRLFNH